MLAMDAPIRSLQRLAANRLSPLPRFVCPQCRNHLRLRPHDDTSRSRTSSTYYRMASTSSNKIPYTEKIRRKIWGTDRPPGQEDPYGPSVILEGNKQRSDPSKTEADPDSPHEGTRDSRTMPSDSDATEATRTMDNATSVDYVPATTWEGLDQIGGSTGWWEEAWDAENHFTGYDFDHEAHSYQAKQRLQFPLFHKAR